MSQKIIGADKPKLVGVNFGSASSAIRQLEVIDPDTITCLEFTVLLKVMDVEGITQGGVFKPDVSIEKELFGKCGAELVSYGAEAFTLSDGSPMANRPKKGDRVIVAKYSGITMRDKDYNLFRFCNDKDVRAIVKGVE